MWSIHASAGKFNGLLGIAARRPSSLKYHHLDFDVLSRSRHRSWYVDEYYGPLSDRHPHTRSDFIEDGIYSDNNSYEKHDDYDLHLGASCQNSLFYPTKAAGRSSRRIFAPVEPENRTLDKSSAVTASEGLPRLAR